MSKMRRYNLILSVFAGTSILFWFIIFLACTYYSYYNVDYEMDFYGITLLSSDGFNMLVSFITAWGCIAWYVTVLVLAIIGAVRENRIISKERLS